MLGRTLKHFRQQYNKIILRGATPKGIGGRFSRVEFQNNSVDIERFFRTKGFSEHFGLAVRELAEFAALILKSVCSEYDETR